MKNQSVHWHEGMFLRPHHFQMAQRYWAFSAAQGNKWDLHYGWGIRSIDIDPDALTNYRFVVRRVQARLRDGTIVHIPEQGTLGPLDLAPAFEKMSTVTVYLAVPVLRTGQPNLQDNPEDALARYRITPQEMPDENTGIDAQQLVVRQLNVQLLLSVQNTMGYEVIPLGRLRLSSDAESTPELEPSFFPPVLACEGWEPLRFSIVHNLCERLGQKIDLLTGRITAEGITFDTEGDGHQEILWQLHELNQAATTLNLFRSVAGMHPVWLHTELCRVVGKLAIFGAERRPPALPHYDHDDLGGCLFALKKIIDTYLDSFIEPDYKQRSFVGKGLGLEVSLEPSWLERGWELYIAIKSRLEAKQVVALFGPNGMLNMKIGSASRVDTIFKFAQEGLHFSHVPLPPRVLPSDSDLVYFQLQRDADDREWAEVQASPTLAVRIVLDALAGDIQGKRAITLQLDDETPTIQMTLYVLRS
ncbi:MAG: type VI secretion system baseplate subunit TssK [Gemmataceae bacterium]